MSQTLSIGIIIIYLGFLFFIAYWAEKNEKSKWVNHPIVYTLSLAVYCTTWTYYGSVGLASEKGIQFLPIYLGPIIAMPLWLVVTRKIIYLTKTNNISSIADFISLRYGNNRSLGALVTFICLVAIIPYISLQLKAISESFSILSSTATNHKIPFADYTLYITIILAIFAAFFGTLSSDASKRKTGIIFSVAVESVLKLLFFLTIGLYITFYLFNGTTDLYKQISEVAPSHLDSFNLNLYEGVNWGFMIFVSFLAMFLLPRQFQVSVVEYTNRVQMKYAIWGFPLYLILFNLFVIFIAWAGIILLKGEVKTDYYSMLVPMSQGHKFISILVFLGGFSAVISMVVVSSVALATMLSNNVIIPYGFLDKFANRISGQNNKTIKNIRRITIFILIFTAYFLYTNLRSDLSLISIGLVSFVVIAQLSPSFFIGLYWNRGSSMGAKLGIIFGFIILLFTLLLPLAYETASGSQKLIEEGYFGVEFLKPYALFNTDLSLSPVNHALFWSLLTNSLIYLTISVTAKGNYRERNYGEMFVNPFEINNLHENAFIWQGEAYYKDIQDLLYRFLGEKRADRAISIFKRKYNISKEAELADARFVNFSEKLLTGTIGGASAKILIASVVKEKPVSLIEVLSILEDNKEARSANKTLQQQSKKLYKLTEELKKVNHELVIHDQQKDNFLDTVAHELKTPITAIKAASEVLQDKDMPEDLRERFLKNIESDTNRLSILINNILNLEKLSTGRELLHLKKNDFNKTIKEAISIIEPIAKIKKVQVLFEPKELKKINYDEDKIIQVLSNILSNALKFSPEKNGKITIDVKSEENKLYCSIKDNGEGVDKEDMPYIFDKFYQTKNQHLKKPSGSGFGLAICKQIMELHKGEIYVDADIKKGAKFIIKLPENLME